MCPMGCGLQKKFPTLTTIPRANGVGGALQKTTHELVLGDSAPDRKNRHQLLWWNHFELGIGAVARLLVGAPP